MSQNEQDFPHELESGVAGVHMAMQNVEKAVVQPLEEASNVHQLAEQVPEPLDCARVDLASVFALNSLAWLWLKTQGINPKDKDSEHGMAIQTELGRVKQSMKRAQELKDRPKRNKVDQEAAKRFVSSSLWQPGDKKMKYEEMKK